jgi:hypothetical protein
MAVYCAKDERHDPMFVIGLQAAMSRIVVRVNPGSAARIREVQIVLGYGPK